MGVAAVRNPIYKGRNSWGARIMYFSGVFSTGAMGALAPAILKNRLLAPTIFGHFSTVCTAGAK